MPVIWVNSQGLWYYTKLSERLPHGLDAVELAFVWLMATGAGGLQSSGTVACCYGAAAHDAKAHGRIRLAKFPVFLSSLVRAPGLEPG